MSRSHSHWQLDVEQLAQELNTRRFKRRLTWRHVAAEVGVSPSTLTRITQGKRPDADALVSLLTWLGYSVPFTVNGHDIGEAS